MDTEVPLAEVSVGGRRVTVTREGDVLSSIQMPLMDVALPALAQVEHYPHMRYMGSKYRLLPTLARVFDQIGGQTQTSSSRGVLTVEIQVGLTW